MVGPRRGSHEDYLIRLLSQRLALGRSQDRHRHQLTGTAGGSHVDPTSSEFGATSAATALRGTSPCSYV